MSAVCKTMGNQESNVHYVNARVPSTVEEHIQGYFIDHADLSLEEILYDQEVLHQSFQANSKIAIASTSANTNPGQGHDGSERRFMEREGQSSRVNSVRAQIARDEAIARELQEVEDQLAASSINENTATAIARPPASREHSSGGRRGNLVTRQDHVEPDNMTYEQLQSLGERIGTEDKGLSEDVISFLPSSTYKPERSSGEEKEGCVICYMEYKKKERLITLPCKHRYHAHCVTRWLKINKKCPLCYEEVFGA